MRSRLWPDDDEQEAAQAAVASYRQQVNDEPALLSLLYDIDLLPEQVTKMVNARRMIAFCECFKAMRAEQIASLFKPVDCSEAKTPEKIT